MNKNLICLDCKKSLRLEKDEYVCTNCKSSYPVLDGIPCFVKNNDAGFDAETYKLLYGMEKKHFWHVGRKEIIYETLKSCLKDRINNIKMLELGCGNGSVLQYLNQRGIDIEGADISIEGLKFCKFNIQVPFYQVNAARTPFAQESYDVVGLFDVIEHVQDDQSLLNEIFRICRKDGRVIITVPANKSLWSYYDTLAEGHKRRYAKNELIEKLNSAGFKIEKISFFLFFLFPPYWIFRKLSILGSRNKKHELKNLLETKTIPVLNSIFLTLLRIEKKLLGKINLPFGVSLICVAQKK